MNHLRLQELRKKQNITQEQLAATLGVNRATISKYESGVIMPPLKQLAKIAEVLNVSFTELFDIDFTEDMRAFVQTLGDYADKEVDEEYIAAKKRKQTIDAAFDQLNPEGQTKAVERVEELTEIPKYQKKPHQD